MRPESASGVDNGAQNARARRDLKCKYDRTSAIQRFFVSLSPVLSQHAIADWVLNSTEPLGVDESPGVVRPPSAAAVAWAFVERSVGGALVHLFGRL